MRPRSFLLLVAGALAVAAAAAWLLPSPGQGVAAGTAAPTFVGGQACTSCHEEQARRWRGSHHDLAMQRASETTILGDFGPTRFTYNGVTSTFFKTEGRFFVRTDGPTGALQDYEIAYAFGVAPLQQYLIALPGGRYQALSIAWDSRRREEGGQRWFHLYPGERVDHRDVLHWTKLSQNWNTQCAECHSTNLRKGYLPAEDRFDTTFSEIDVSCEACHGPGSRHVAWEERAKARGGRTEGSHGLVIAFGDRKRTVWEIDLATGIAKPDRPPGSRTEVEACGRCHARRGTMVTDYTYGLPLADTHHPALLEAGLYHADGQMLDEVYNWGSFLQSRMYRAGVTCSDCHDPHGLKVRVSPDAVCSGCHQRERFDTPRHHFHPRRSKGASCVACHMPTETYMVVDRRHDHSFRVPRPDLSVALGVPNTCTACHRDRSARWAAETVRRWYPKGRAETPHFAHALDAGRRLRPGAEAALVALAADGAQPGIARATAVSLLSRVVSPASLPALEKAAGDPDPLVRLGAAAALEALERGERLRIGSSLLADPVRAVRVEAVVPVADVPPEEMTAGQRMAFDRALDDFFQAQRANAERPESHVNLGLVQARRGRHEEARRAYETAIRIGPWFVPAYANLADLLRAEGRDDEGEAVLRRGLAIAPGHAALHHALGLLLVRQKRLDEALGELQHAAELAPEDPGFAYAWAIGLHSTGRTERALAVLRQAHERSPGSVELLAALVTINRDRGAMREARAWARRLVAAAPGNPQALRLRDEVAPGGPGPLS